MTGNHKLDYSDKAAFLSEFDFDDMKHGTLVSVEVEGKDNYDFFFTGRDRDKVYGFASVAGISSGKIEIYLPSLTLYEL